MRCNNIYDFQWKNIQLILAPLHNMSNKLWSKQYHSSHMKIYVYERIVIRRILLYTRVEVPSMQILRVERVHTESTDGRKSLTSLIWQSIVWFVFCTVKMYMNVRFHWRTTVQMQHIYYQIKECLRNALIKIHSCLRGPRVVSCFIFPVYNMEKINQHREDKRILCVTSG